MLPRGLRMLGRRTGPGEKDWQKFAMQTGEGKVFHRREQWAVNRQITEAGSRQERPVGQTGT